MNRRKFVLCSAAGMVGSALSRTLKAAGQRLGPSASAEDAGELFPVPNLSECAWSQFTASGSSEPFCGLIYRKSKPPECGLPLGAIGTGGLDLDTDGTFGYCSLFGSFVPPRGPFREPLLSLRLGKKNWVLATRHREEIEDADRATEIH
jgi:hypothetical protein